MRMQDDLHPGVIFNENSELGTIPIQSYNEIRTAFLPKHEESNIDTIQFFRIFCAVPKTFTNHVTIYKIHV